MKNNALACLNRGKHDSHGKIAIIKGNGVKCTPQSSDSRMYAYTASCWSTFKNQRAEKVRPKREDTRGKKNTGKIVFQPGEALKQDRKRLRGKGKKESLESGSDSSNGTSRKSAP